MTHLVIPDTHNYHGDDSTRLDWLGQYIEDQQPEVIFIMGDWWDMNSINYFDKYGTLRKEGEKISLDIDAGMNAIRRIFYTYQGANEKRAKQKKKLYVPRIIFIEGNHEDRLNRFINDNPLLEGLLCTVKDILHTHMPGIEWVPYGKSIEVDDILYTHILFSGGRPISGRVNTCGDALKLVDKSIVFVHTHRLEWKQFMRLGSNKLITAFNAGCFIKTQPKYVEASNPNWWSGVSMLEPDGEGNFDMKIISIHTLKSIYA